MSNRIREVGQSYSSVSSTGNTLTIGSALAPGNYEVRGTLVCAGSGCNNATDVITFSVLPNPEVSISTNDNVLCIGEMATLRPLLLEASTVQM